MTKLFHRRTIMPLLMAAIFARLFATALGQETRSDRHLFLVDISDSMWAKPKSQLPQSTEFEVRRDKLKAWLNSHSNSRVTLMSFNTDLHSELTCDLRNPSDRQRAEMWANELAIKRPRGTYLWTCVEKALRTASRLSQQEPGEPVTLHVFTDRVNTQSNRTLQQLKGEFPDAKWPADIAEGRGDFDITLQSPLPPASPPSSPTPVPTNTATAPPTTTVTSSPKPTPTPSGAAPIESPSPVPFQVASPTPCSSASPCSGNPFFVTSDALKVFHGQFVQFVNKTEPKATGYRWTVQRSGTPLVSYDKVAAGERSADTHWGYRFFSSSSEPESYTIRLTAIYAGTEVEAPPVTVVVHRPPGIFARFCASIGSVSGALISGLSAISTFIGLLGALKKLRGDNPARLGETPAQALSRRWLRFALIAVAFIVSLTFFVIFASNTLRSDAEQTVVTDTSITVGDGSQRPHQPQQVSPPTAPGQTSSSLFRTIVLFLAAALLIAATGGVIIRILKDRPRANLLGAKILPGREDGESSLTSQLEEVQKLSEAGVLPNNQLSSFKRALFERLRQKYKLPPKPPKSAELPSSIKSLLKLLDALLAQTQRGELRWRLRYGDNGIPRFRVDISDPQTPPSSPPAFAVETFRTDGAVDLEIFDKFANRIEIDRGTPAVSDYIQTRIAKLHKRAKDSALRITDTLHDMLAILTKPKRP